jgi:hypothetical protein
VDGAADVLVAQTFRSAGAAGLKPCATRQAEALGYTAG